MECHLAADNGGNIFSESEDELNITVLENGKGGGSDSGVEINGGLCDRCKASNEDSQIVTSSNSSIVSGNSYSPCCADAFVNNSGDTQLCSDFRKLNFNSCPSENGSESSSADSLKKERPASVALRKANLPRSAIKRSSSANGRNAVSPRKCDCAPQNNSNGRITSKTELRTGGVRNNSNKNTEKSKQWRSASSIRKSNEDGLPPDGKPSSKLKLSSSAPIFETAATRKCATLPRRVTPKSNETNGRSSNVTDWRTPTGREPSLNRAASLRKKFVDSSLMGGGSVASTGYSHSVKSPTAHSSSSKGLKTKIYHEIEVQTALTNDDLKQLLVGIPVKTANNNIQRSDCGSQTDGFINMTNSNDACEKLRIDIEKQKNSMERVEKETVTIKDEKDKLQKELTTFELGVKSLLRHKNCNTREEMLTQLEREIAHSDKAISQQQREIDELQDMCCQLKQDLEKSYTVQRSLVESQRVTELESMELQEFLQAEKSLLNDSLKDLEAELCNYKNRLVIVEKELTDKTEQCSHLMRISEQQRQENLLLNVRLSNLEQRSKDLLLQQGAAISSASVALSSLASRFDSIFDQLRVPIISQDDSSETVSDNLPFDDVVNSSNIEVNSSGSRQQRDMQNGTRCATVNGVIGYAKFEYEATAKHFAEFESSSSTPYLLKANSYFPPLNRRLSRSSLTINDDITDLLSASSKRNSLPANLVAAEESLDSNRTESNIGESLNNISEIILNKQQQLIPPADGSSEDSFLKEFVIKHNVTTLMDQIADIDNALTDLLKCNQPRRGSSFTEKSNLWTTATMSECAELARPRVPENCDILSSRLRRHCDAIDNAITVLKRVKENAGLPFGDIQRLVEELESIEQCCDSETSFSSCFG